MLLQSSQERIQCHPNKGLALVGGIDKKGFGMVSTGGGVWAWGERTATRLLQRWASGRPTEEKISKLNAVRAAPSIAYYAVY